MGMWHGMLAQEKEVKRTMFEPQTGCMGDTNVSVALVANYSRRHPHNRTSRSEAQMGFEAETASGANRQVAQRGLRRRPVGAGPRGHSSDGAGRGTGGAQWENQGRRRSTAPEVGLAGLAASPTAGPRSPYRGAGRRPRDPARASAGCHDLLVEAAVASVAGARGARDHQQFGYTRPARVEEQ